MQTVLSFVSSESEKMRVLRVGVMEIALVCQAWRCSADLCRAVASGLKSKHKVFHLHSSLIWSGTETPGATFSPLAQVIIIHSTLCAEANLTLTSPECNHFAVDLNAEIA